MNKSNYWENHINNYEEDLRNRELSKNTVEAYVCDIKKFNIWLIDNNYIQEKLENLEKSKLIEYKEKLRLDYKPSTINRKIAAINGFLKKNDLDQLCLKAVEADEKSYRPECLTEEEIKKLLNAAYNSDKYKYLEIIIKVLTTTGIRISELSYVTKTSLNEGILDIVQSKGRSRKVPLDKELCKILKKYIKERKTLTEQIFENFDRNKIYRNLKSLSKLANVDSKKVYPHGFRHYFAIKLISDKRCTIVDVSILLGHKSMETTKIYLLRSIVEVTQLMKPSFENILKKVVDKHTKKN